MRIPAELKSRIRHKLINSFINYFIFYSADEDIYLASSYVTFADLVKLNAVLEDFNVKIGEIHILNENELIMELLPTEKWVGAPYMMKRSSRLETLQKITKKMHKLSITSEKISELMTSYENRK